MPIIGSRGGGSAKGFGFTGSPGPKFVTATGGTITESGDYKIHTFTGPGTFTVTEAGNEGGSNSVDYLVVAGGGGGGVDMGVNATPRSGGGGGAGGFRESKATSAPWTASPLASSTSLPVSAQGYPITVGAGGTAGLSSPSTQPTVAGDRGSSSIFSTITSTGGGGGMGHRGPGDATERFSGSTDGGSGGGYQSDNPPPETGVGNSPPVSPPQGNPAGLGGDAPSYGYGGGGGATAAGSNGTPSPTGGGAGGTGANTSISASPTAYAGGGGSGLGGAASPCGTGGAGNGTSGTTNRGGGGGGNRSSNAGGGGSGIVIIRYKYQ
jgi:hypothetical protein